eukprot:6403272-Amphidinium_carterae.2
MHIFSSSPKSAHRCTHAQSFPKELDANENGSLDPDEFNVAEVEVSGVMWAVQCPCVVMTAHMNLR